MEANIDGSTHDAAPVMVKYGDSISAISQLFHNLGLHLAVVNSFYKCPKSNQNQNQPDLDDNNEMQI